MRMSGTIDHATVCSDAFRVSDDSFEINNAHCPAKQSSATVATLRPTKIDDRGEFQRHCCSRSTRGSMDRNAQATAKMPESKSCWAT
jgi:hypothetical protein